MLNRWIETTTCSTRSADEGVGCIVFSPLAQGLLTDRYLDGIPEDSRAATGGVAVARCSPTSNLARVRALNEIAQRRGQTLAQLALAWALRDPRMTSLVIGASSVAQLEDNVAALDRPRLRPTTSWPRSTGTPPTPGSTSGRGPARLDVARRAPARASPRTRRPVRQ